MTREEKLKQFRRLLKKGEPEGELRALMRDQGFSDEEIRQVFMPHQYDMRNWYLVFAILFTLIGLYTVNNIGGVMILLLGGYLWYSLKKENDRVKKNTEQR